MNATGIAWYKKNQWEEFRRLSADEVDKTFEEWERNALQLCSDMKKRGVPVKQVPVNVSELALWCRSTRKPCNAEARAEYLAIKLQSM